jgi:hypothetical protein
MGYFKDGVYYNPKVIEIKPLDNYRLWCRLSTGEKKVYDFTPLLEWEMFQHLRDLDKFKDVGISKFGCPAWVDEETGLRDLEFGVSYIVEYGEDVSDLNNFNKT